MAEARARLAQRDGIEIEKVLAEIQGRQRRHLHGGVRVTEIPASGEVAPEKRGKLGCYNEPWTDVSPTNVRESRRRCA